MFVSGFITYYKFKPKESTTIFLKRKFLSLIIPFLIWATINYFLNTSVFLFNVIIIFNKIRKILNLFAYPIVWGLILSIPYSDYYLIYMIKWMFPFCFMGYLINRYKGKFKKMLKFMQIMAFVAFPIFLYFGIVVTIF